MQREETDRMGQMERGHTAEVQPDCMTEAYTVGISETHIMNNATVIRVRHNEDAVTSARRNNNRQKLKIGGGLRLIGGKTG